MAEISFQAKLAEAVEKRPCLYDFKLKEYSNRDKVRIAWEAVAKEVNNSVKECKESWRNMRIVFTRNIKTPPSGSKAKKKVWPLLNTMMFLKSYVVTKGNDLPGNLPSPPQSLDDERSVVSETHGGENSREEEEEEMERENVASSHELQSMGPPPKTNKRSKSTTADDVVLDYITSRTTASKDTPRKHFLISLLPDVEEMTPAQFKKFRRDVVGLIDRINEPSEPTAENGTFRYQQLPYASPISPHCSWSGESTSCASTSCASTSSTTNQSDANQFPETNTPNDELYTDLQPYLTRKFE